MCVYVCGEGRLICVGWGKVKRSVIRIIDETRIPNGGNHARRIVIAKGINIYVWELMVFVT